MNVKISNGNGRKRLRSGILSTFSDEDFGNASNENMPLAYEMHEPSSEQEDFKFDLEAGDPNEEWQEIRERSGVKNEYPEEEKLLIEDTDSNNPVSLYKLFVTDYMLEMVVLETNKYAVQCLNNSLSSSKGHQQIWQPVTRDEINTFIGILLIMGVVQLPEIRLYWSNKNMYTNARIKNAMKRDRFLAILKFLHFSDNTTATPEDPLNEIQSICETVVATFKGAVQPGKNVIIDESTVPWRGRLNFRQYIPGKQNKLHKLCLPEGYTYNIDIYAGKTATITKTHSHDVVMRLMDGLLFEGRILCTDSYYTSVPLAEELLLKGTFISGTIEMNEYLSLQAKQKQCNGIMSFENRRGVKFLKWTDKSVPLCMLTTCRNHTCTIVRGKSGKLQPDAVFFYNDAKKGTNLADQLSSYYNGLRKTIEWYKKIFIDLICGTCLANAWYIHKKWGNKQISLLKFREEIIDHLLINNHQREELPIENQIPSKKGLHFLNTFNGLTREARRRCRECYKCLCERNGRQYAMKKAKKVTTYCNQCEGKPALCLECFKTLHGGK